MGKHKKAKKAATKAAACKRRFIALVGPAAEAADAADATVTTPFVPTSAEIRDAFDVISPPGTKTVIARFAALSPKDHSLVDTHMREVQQMLLGDMPPDFAPLFEAVAVETDDSNECFAVLTATTDAFNAVDRLGALKLYTLSSRQK